MGWEVRHNGRRYLYRNVRVLGKPVKEYLAAEDLTGVDTVWVNMLDEGLTRLQKRQAKCRAVNRKAQRKYRERIDGLLAAVDKANTDLRIVVDGTLYSIGFHKHNRGEWRMQWSKMKILKEIEEGGERIKALESQITAMTTPMIKIIAPSNDAEAVEVFAKARAGDAAAQQQVRALIVDRGWMGWIGDLGEEATRQLINRAAGGDPVWKAGLKEKAEVLGEELLGTNPTMLEQLLVRRIVNGWIATHTLELELTLRPPTKERSKEYLDKALSRAQKRMTQAMTELARVRRLQAPRVLVQLQRAANQAFEDTTSKVPLTLTG